MTDAADAVAAIQERAEAALSDETVWQAIIRAGTLQQYIDTLTALVHEARLHVGDHGLRSTVVDPANVAMYDPIELDRAVFESFESPGQAVVGVSLTTLDERLGPANSDDLVHLAADMETGTLTVQFRNITQSVALIDPQSIRAEPDTSDLELSNQMVVEGGEFAAAIDACDLTGDHLAIRADPEGERVLFVTEGDVDDTVVEFGHDELISAVVNDPGESLFSLEYLVDMTDPIPNDAEVTIRFDDEFPVKFEYAACDGHLTVSAMVAPRIQ